MVLPIAPQILDGVELRCVRRQKLEDDAALLRFDVFLHQTTPVAAQAVPDDQELPGEMTLEKPQEKDNLGIVPGNRRK